MVVVGSMNLDLIATTARLPAPGETVGGGSFSTRPGGKGANQAVAAARLGASVRMIGAVGRDEEGHALIANLERAGVDAEGVRRSSGLRTGTALVVVDERGENQIVVCPGANAEVTVAGLELAEDDSVLCQLEVSVETVVAAARRTRGFFAVNAAPALPLPDELIERADLIIVNETEYGLIPALREASLVAVTYGAAGSAFIEKGAQVAFAPTKKVHAVDTVGAGDAFCAAIVLALQRGLDFEAALRAANAVAADTVTHPGAQPPLQRLEAYLVA